MQEKKETYQRVENYLAFVRSKGRFLVTFGELKEHIQVSGKAVLQSLFRLKQKKKIAQIRRGFYVIVPSEYSATGMLPYYLFLDDLMNTLGCNYYVALSSAAALHGAGHQQPMECTVIVKSRAVHNISTNNLRISFFIKSDWPKNEIVLKNTDAGYLAVSSPAQTALDLVMYQSRIGGINRVLQIIEELSENISYTTLLKAAKKFKQTAAIQRLGYLLEFELNNSKLTKAASEALRNRKIYSILLSFENTNTENRTANNQWKVIPNIQIQPEQ